MLRKASSRFFALGAALLLLVGTVGTVSAANPNRTYSFTACWDDGSTSGSSGVVGTQTWSAFRVTSLSFGFENVAFGDVFAIPGSRAGSEQSGWLTPQSGGGAFVGALFNGHRIVATDSIPEPTGGWSTLDPC